MQQSCTLEVIKVRCRFLNAVNPGHKATRAYYLSVHFPATLSLRCLVPAGWHSIETYNNSWYPSTFQSPLAAGYFTFLGFVMPCFSVAGHCQTPGRTISNAQLGTIQQLLQHPCQRSSPYSTLPSCGQGPSYLTKWHLNHSAYEIVLHEVLLCW